jgi:phosphoribosylaminoimidazole-succinocarboxamide synthase
MLLFKPSKSDGYFLKECWSDEKGVEVVDLRYEFGQLLNTIMLSDAVKDI